MLANDKYGNPFFSGKDEEIKRVLDSLKEEISNLQLQNEQLKRELEREQLLHKNLYNEWKQLTTGEPISQDNKPKKIRRFVRKRFSKSSLYGILILIILLSVFITYFMFIRPGRNSSSQLALPVTDTTVIDTNKIDEIDQKSTIAKPAIKIHKKKGDTFSEDKKAEFPPGNNEPVSAEEINLTRR
jgi:hypothetical protein